MDDNWYGSSRLPKEIEEVFFKSKENPSTIANNLVSYAEKINTTLDPEMEEVIKKHPDSVVRYMRVVRNSGKAIGLDLIDSLKGNSSCLAQAAYHFGRLPRELEKDITNPDAFVNYAQALGTRIVEQEPIVFFDENKDQYKIANCVAKYAAVVGPLPVEFNRLLKANNESILEYATVLYRHNKTLDKELEDNLAGDNNNLYRYAQHHLRKRLPVHLEKTLTNPQVIYNYARQIVRGRLPEELENHLASDLSAAASYAFDVIRGYSSVRLPDVVHSAMVLTSSANLHDYNIKRYIKECENDTTIPGSW
jgi:hypothetical protein